MVWVRKENVCHSCASHSWVPIMFCSTATVTNAPPSGISSVHFSFISIAPDHSKSYLTGFSNDEPMSRVSAPIFPSFVFLHVHGNAGRDCKTQTEQQQIHSGPSCHIQSHFYVDIDTWEPFLQVTLTAASSLFWLRRIVFALGSQWVCKHGRCSLRLNVKHCPPLFEVRLWERAWVRPAKAGDWEWEIL